MQSIVKNLIVLGATCVSVATAFVPSHLFSHRHNSVPPLRLSGRDNSRQHPMTLFYKNETMLTTEALPPSLTVKKRRDAVKKELIRAAITNFDAEGKPNYAEDLMKKLERMRPWEKTAYHSELNARWSFVFTGVPTIGMKLITLLSRISVGFPIVDFRDVYLEVTNDQSHVKAVVTWRMVGIPFELNVDTSLTPDETHPEGNMLLEHFQGITLSGIPIPTPESWATTRTLEISYLDEDMMIARTSGGEPHLLLRNSHCRTEDAECDIDNELTQFFDEAREMYGEKIARCLVDRDYGETETEACSEGGRDPARNILSLDPRTLISPNHNKAKN